MMSKDVLTGNSQLSTPPLAPQALMSPSYGEVSSKNPDKEKRMDYFKLPMIDCKWATSTSVSPRAESPRSRCKIEEAVKLAYPSPLETDEDSEPEFTPSNRAARFLAVDDNQINLRILTRMLNKLYPCAEVISTQDPATVMDMVSTGIFDVVFLDIEMPEVSGVELAEMIRAESTYDRTGLIAVTTKAMPSDIKLYDTLGIDHTFGKPLSKSATNLLSRIEAVIEKRRL
ncbi:Piso0_002716 [Millerozyma farinosa CBS 7064]|uniref:Stress response regulator protein 1 n=1 Tax=Pichia sorbitophila (strain ATCC MYA-4447 / BCRC 22081 / CBS 7064 / NBRC 10061 / NRRL Y-12695) TaxID=559304 RepID=G8YFS4_PICSO|nr:Piso0_002716 [Millerozyma farinosa CBS 7064]